MLRVPEPIVGTPPLVNRLLLLVVLPLPENVKVPYVGSELPLQFNVFPQLPLLPPPTHVFPANAAGSTTPKTPATSTQRVREKRDVFFKCGERLKGGGYEVRI